MPRKTAGKKGRFRRNDLCFNEAAARCRGKPVARAAGVAGHDGASMRPRPDAAENLRTAPRWPVRPDCFNEAAARCRGKPQRSHPGGMAFPACFNEAAARCRGKPFACQRCYDE